MAPQFETAVCHLKMSHSWLIFNQSLVIWCIKNGELYIIYYTPNPTNGWWIPKMMAPGKGATYNLKYGLFGYVWFLGCTPITHHFKDPLIFTHSGFHEKMSAKEFWFLLLTDRPLMGRPGFPWLSRSECHLHWWWPKMDVLDVSLGSFEGAQSNIERIPNINAFGSMYLRIQKNRIFAVFDPIFRFHHFVSGYFGWKKQKNLDPNIYVWCCFFLIISTLPLITKLTAFLLPRKIRCRCR